ncbi:MAG: 3-hydroxybutyryl-CoA dehydrogenase, partial [Chitinophagales bacterium]|nr:3-hydroxybutyryl-CoA dehydrogenase [Chitinophagales bacterium]
MKNITVIGAGTMGNGITHVFAMKGFSVTMVDVAEAALQKGLQNITNNLDRMVNKGTIRAEDKTNTLQN